MKDRLYPIAHLERLPPRRKARYATAELNEYPNMLPIVGAPWP